MKQRIALKIILLCTGFFMSCNILAQTTTVDDMIKMASMSKVEMVKDLQKNYTYVNKQLPDSASDIWNCTRLTYGGNSSYTYTRESADNKTTITLNMTYQNLYDKLKEEVKAMKLKENDGLYENDKFLISLQRIDKQGRYTYTVIVQQK